MLLLNQNNNLFVVSSSYRDVKHYHITENYRLAQNLCINV